MPNSASFCILVSWDNDAPLLLAKANYNTSGRVLTCCDDWFQWRDSDWRNYVYDLAVILLAITLEEKGEIVIPFQNTQF